MRSVSRLAPGLLIALAATACTPHDAEVEGSYHVWLAANSSASVAEEAVRLGPGSTTTIDCFNSEEDVLEESACGVELDGGSLPNWDWPSEFSHVQSSSYQGPWGFLLDDAFYLKEDKLDPWRSEAVITSEGDFQLTLHNRLDGGEDFRIAFVIDPVFQPQECIQSGYTCYTLDGEEPVDDDNDGWADMDDPDCLFGAFEEGYSSSAPIELLDCDGICDCNDGLDNDGDGVVDADDPDCTSGFDDNESDDVSCSDGEDNDGDGYSDRNDPDCRYGNSEDGSFAVAACNDGVDNDADGLIDSEDEDCRSAWDNDEVLSPSGKSACTDDFDNDGDGWIDYDDADCGTYGDEVGYSVAACNDDVDNDGDGFIDAEDAGCTDSSYDSEDDGDGSCSDGADNDADGWTDNADPDCFYGGVEDNSFFGLSGCNDGIDNNPPEEGEGDIDADDSVCKTAWQVEADSSVTTGSCTTAEGATPEDEDGDGWFDAEDPDCFDGGKREITLGKTVCNDGRDNDSDGLVDADDPGCVDAVRSTEEDLDVLSDCEDGLDNDGDGWVDFEDSGCDTGSFEALGDLTDCADGLDNDGDGDIDMADVDCLSSADVDERASSTCEDLLDNDGDGWVDAQDPDCLDLGQEYGFTTGQCNDGIDNDGDGDVDGDDANCTNADVALERDNQCADGEDNDGDGYTDEADADCGLFDDGLEDGRFTATECTDGVDNDGDGLVDAADADCEYAMDNLEGAHPSGEPVLINSENKDWTAEYSADEDGYSIYYLNAGSYQLNPADEEDFWTLPQDWLSGYAVARYAADDFIVTPATYNYMLSEFDGITAFSQTEAFYADFAIEAQEQAAWWSEQAYTWAMVDPDLYDGFNYRTEDNTWRRLDSLTTGIDGWLERSPNYVRIADGSNVEPGGSVSGDFQILLTASDNASVMLVQGTFDVEKLREDRWSYGILEDELVERNDTVVCGQSASAE